MKLSADICEWKSVKSCFKEINSQKLTKHISPFPFLSIEDNPINHLQRARIASKQRFLPLNIEDCIESKIKNVEFRWKAADNVTADLTGESPFWIVKREKLDQLLLDESLSNGAQIMRSLLIEKIIKNINHLSIETMISIKLKLDLNILNSQNLKILFQLTLILTQNMH